MKNLSKVLAVVLAMALCLSMVGVVSAFDDVAETASYSEAVSILNSLGILKGYEDGTFGPDKTITRAEFATVVCRAAGFGETLGGQVVFNDVPASHWAAGYIALASQQGIVNGYGDGNFGPEDPVKYQEAIKMVVVALGYAPAAETNGGYPGGHQVIAAQRGILNNISGATSTEPASRAVVAQMIYNSLEVPIMTQKTYGANAQYGYSNTLLLNKMGITKFYGKVYNTSMSSDNIKEGKVQLEIDNQVTAIEDQSNVANVRPNTSNYSANPYIDALSAGNKMIIKVTDEAIDATAKDLLDYASVMYVKDADSDDADLLAIAKRGTRNQEVSFASEDIYDKKTANDSNALTNGQGNLYVYTDKDNEKYNKYKLALTKIYVNDEVKDAADFDTYAVSSKTADIRLLCNSSEGDDYGIAYVTEYKDFVVDDINARTYKISADQGSLILDETDSSYRFDIIKDGQKITFADIQVNDVLSVAGVMESDGITLKKGKVIVTSNQVTGTVETYSETDKTVTVAGTKYSYENITVGDRADVQIGDQATFYINARGVIVGVDTEQTNTTLRYGFATVVAKSSGIDSNYQIKLLTSEGEWNTLSINTRVAINGDPAETTSSIADASWKTKIAGTGATSTTVAEGTKYYVNKVVGYEVNSSNKVTKIYFKNDTGRFDVKNDNDGASYYASMNTLGAATLNDNTAIFSIDDTKATAYTAPTTVAIASTLDEEDVTVAKKDALVDRNEYGTFNMYNLDKNNNAAAIFGVGLVGSLDNSSAFFTVSDVTTKNNEEGERGKLLEGYVGGEAASLFVSDNATIEKIDYTQAGTEKVPATTASSTASLKKGSVIIFSKDSKGEANKVRILVDASDIYNVAGNKYSLKADMLGSEYKFKVAGSEDYTYIFKYVRAKNSSKFYVLDTLGGVYNKDSEDTLSISSVNGAVYDPELGSAEDGKVTIAVAGDIYFGDKTVSDDTTKYEGDIIFAKVFGDNIVKDFVSFRSEFSAN